MLNQFKRKLKHLALLDAVVEQEWEYRYYSYNSLWAEQEEMASLRNGSGGECFVLFDGDNVAFKCTSPVDGLVDDFEVLKVSVPKRFSSFLDEPAFSMSEGSCIWYLDNDSWVKLGKSLNDLPDPEKIIAMSAADYCQYVEEYFERKIDITWVESVFAGKFGMEAAKGINPDIDVELLAQDLQEIGKVT